MIYAIARFDWLGMECTAILDSEGWKVPRSIGVEVALNVVAKLSTAGPTESGAPVDRALESILRIFPNAAIDRPPFVRSRQPDESPLYAAEAMPAATQVPVQCEFRPGGALII